MIRATDDEWVTGRRRQITASWSLDGPCQKFERQNSWLQPADPAAKGNRHGVRPVGHGQLFEYVFDGHRYGLFGDVKLNYDLFVRRASRNTLEHFDFALDERVCRDMLCDLAPEHRHLVAADDKMIPPPAQHGMAKRANAAVAEVKGSHAIYVSQPQAVIRLIEQATKGI